MSIETDGLPRRFPVGTRYIVEGAPDKKGKFRVTSRFLIFPNGREVHLSTPATRKQPRAVAARQKTQTLKARASRLRERKKR
jgi:hypothetical protein